MTPVAIATIVIFCLAYVLMLAIPKFRVAVAFIASMILIGVHQMTPNEVFVQAFGESGLNVVLMIGGTMVLVGLFIQSKMPQKLSDLLVKWSPNAMWAIVFLSLFSGFISAFVDNVATVLMVAPVALELCKKQNINPILPIIAIAVSSNLQGAATLVGDTTSILLAQTAGMSFADFFFMNVDGTLRAGMFWVTEIGALLATCYLFIVFRKEKAKLEIDNITEVKDYVPTILMVLMVVILITVSFFEKPDYTNGLTCFLLAVVGLIYEFIKGKCSKKECSTFATKLFIQDTVNSIDFGTLILLSSLFTIIFALNKAGIIDMLAQLIGKAGGGNAFIIYTIIVFASVVISAFIDNIPYVMTMLPVVTSLAASLGIDPHIFYFGLLVGATLGGNITPIGASANITAIGILRKQGYEVKTTQFLRIGVPFTLIAVLSGYGLVWLFWL